MMPIDAWREGDDYVVELDLPGSSPTPSMSASNMRRSRYGPNVPPSRKTVTGWSPNAARCVQPAAILGSGLDPTRSAPTTPTACC
ncbi:putative heat shock protein, partial [Mycobacterium xenopi 4042]